MRLLRGAWHGNGPASLLAIYLCSLLIRAGTALLVRGPGYTDAFYYYDIAANLHAGRGFVEDFIWNFLETPAAVSHPANTYWGPLGSVLLLPIFWIFGASFRAAQATMVLLSAMVPVLSYVTARELRLTHAQGLIAAALTIFGGIYLVFWTAPDGFVPFAIAACVALLAMGRGRSGNWRWNALAGAAIAVAQLARSDAALLLGVFALLQAIDVWQSRHRRAPLNDRTWTPIAGGATQVTARLRLAGTRDFVGKTEVVSGLRLGGAISSLVITSAAYLAVTAPWLYRNWIDLGAPFVNSALKAMFLREYNDMFRYGIQIDLGYFLAMGWQAILLAKLQAALLNLKDIAEVLFLLAPVVALGVWALRRERRALSYLLYLIVLYTAMAFAFNLQAQFGSLLHSLAALLPFLMAAAALGVDKAVAILVRYRAHLSLAFTLRFLRVVVIAAQVTLAVGLGARAITDWESRYSHALYPQAIDWLSSRLEPGEPVMILDAPAYNYLSGRPAVVTPNNDPDRLVAVAHRYNVRYLVLETAHMRPLDALYTGRVSYPAVTPRVVFHNDRGQELRVFEIQ